MHATVDALLYLPASQTVQLVPFVSLSVSVIQPGAHATQLVLPVLPWYCPIAHPAHATVDASLYCPAAHATHIVPFEPASVSDTDPASHTAHATVDTLLY